MKTDGFALLVRNGDLAQNLFFDTFEMEDSEVEWLRNLLSADTVIMRFEGTDYYAYAIGMTAAGTFTTQAALSDRFTTCLLYTSRPRRIAG